MKRYKNVEDYDVAEHVEDMQAAARGKPAPHFETAEYRAHRSAVLRAGGLDEEADDVDVDAETPLADLTVQQHLDRIRRS